MSRSRPFRPFVQKNLAQMLEVRHIEPDEDGAYSFGYGPIDIMVRVSEDLGLIALEFLALLLQNPKHARRVLGALNQMNGCRIPLRVFKEGNDVVAAWVVPLETMDGRQFKDLCNLFCDAADDIGRHLRRQLGGRAPNRVPKSLLEEPVEA